MMLTSPVKRAEKPAPNPVSIDNARAGRLFISARIVPPAGTDLYNESARDDPMKSNINITIMSQMDHLPRFVLAITPPKLFLCSYYTDLL
jgi:hypothetical protein